MSNYTLSYNLSAVDKFSQTFKTLDDKHEKLKSRFTNNQPEIKAKDGTKSTFDGIEKRANGLKSMMGGLIAGLSVGAAISVIKDVTAAYAQSAEASAKLETVFKATGKASSNQINQLKEHASVLQDIGVIEDDVAVAGMAQLATFGLGADSVEKLSGAMGNLLVNQKGLNATQGDAQQTANLLGKVMQGQVGSLAEYGVTLSEAQKEIIKNGTEAEKTATLVEVLGQNFGDMNAEMAKTDAGKIQQAKNAFGDLKEVMGSKILPVFGQFAKFFVDGLPVAQAKFAEFGAKVAPYLSPIIASFQQLQEKFMVFWTAIQPILPVLQERFMVVFAGIAGVVNGLIISLGGVLDFLTGVFTGDWGKAWTGIGTIFKGVFASISAVGKTYMNGLIILINGVVDGLNKIKFKAPAWVPGIGGQSFGVNIPKIPLLAKGTSYWGGGSAVVGEAGAELVTSPKMMNLQQGSKVIPAYQTEKLLRGSSGGSASSVVVNINGVSKSTDEIIGEMMPKLKIAIANSI